MMLSYSTLGCVFFRQEIWLGLQLSGYGLQQSVEMMPYAHKGKGRYRKRKVCNQGHIKALGMEPDTAS